MDGAAVRLLKDLVRRQSTSAAGFNDNDTNPATDTYAVGFALGTSPSKQQPQIVPGVVQDVVAGGHAYKVSYGFGSFGWATPNSTDAAFGSFGLRSVTTYPVGTRVRVLKDSDLPDYGTIISAEPYASFHRAYQPADSWWPIFRSGHSADLAHRYTANKSIDTAKKIDPSLDAVDLIDLASGRPLDSTSAGEWGVHADTGMWVGADPFHAFVRADEATGFFVFYKDQKTRLAAGQHFEFWAPNEESEQFDTVGELHGVKQRWVYPWEGSGLDRWNQVTPTRFNTVNQPGQGFVLNTSDAIQLGSGEANIEPESSAQMPVARWFEYSGYLGQGGKELHALPRQWPVYFPDKVSYVGQVLKYNVATGKVDRLVAGPDDTLVTEAPPQASVVPPNDRLGPEGDPVTRDPDNYGVMKDVEDLDPTTISCQHGVLDKTVALTGKLALRSAKSVAIVRRPAIPIPRRRLRPNDPAIDYVGFGLTPTDPELAPEYASSGLYVDSAVIADTVEHKVTGDLNFPLGAKQRVSALHDILAYTFNWESLHPFAYRYKEWFTVEERNIKAMTSSTGADVEQLGNQVVPDYSELALQQHLTDPDPMYLEVDHRYGRSKYYPNESGIVLLDDGSVVVYDGAGSEIKMYSGRIEFNCAADVYINAGRNIVLQAGHDLILKGRDSVDVSASKKDVRVKAERNTQIVSGNGGCGGIVLESKALCPGYGFEDNQGEAVASSGIVMVARSSQVYAYATDVVLEADNGANGRIVLNANEEGVIRTRAKFNYTLVEDRGARVDYFLDGTSDVAAVNEHTSTRSIFGTTVYTYGHILNYGTYDELDNLETGPDPDRLEDLENRVNYLKNELGIEEFLVKNVPDGAELVEYTARTDEQYLTATGYTIMAARWQMLADNDNQTLPVWRESLIVGTMTSAENYPYPGSPWVATDTFKMHRPRFVDPSERWVAEDRLDDNYDPTDFYTNPTLLTVSQYSPDDAYTVIVEEDEE